MTRKLPQQPSQSGREGLRQARAEQGEARATGTEFEAPEGKNAPDDAGEDVPGARRPNEDSNLAPPSNAGGVPPGKSQIQRSASCGAISARYIWEIQSHQARAHIMPDVHAAFRHVI